MRVGARQRLHYRDVHRSAGRVHHTSVRYALLLTLLVGCAAPVLEDPVREPAPGDVQVVWTGDTLLADAALPLLTDNGYGHPFEYVQELLAGDITIGNAEGPITTLFEPYNEGQTWSYNALPEAAQALADAGFDAVSVANNHLFDRGPDGMRDTLGHLDDAGVLAFGGGETLSDALRPFVFENGSGPVAVFGFGRSSSWVPAAGDGPGQALLNGANAVAAQEVADAAGAVWTVAYVHWGQNYSDVTGQQRTQAEMLVAAGFDLIIGHGPHNQQPVAHVDGVPVLFSLGNFAFGTPGRWDDEFPGFGLVATTVFGTDGLDEISLRCIVTDNAVVAFQPVPCNEDEAAAVLGALGDVLVLGDRATVTPRGLAP